MIRRINRITRAGRSVILNAECHGHWLPALMPSENFRQGESTRPKRADMPEDDCRFLIFAHERDAGFYMAEITAVSRFFEAGDIIGRCL